MVILINVIFKHFHVWSPAVPSLDNKKLRKIPVFIKKQPKFVLIIKISVPYFMVSSFFWECNIHTNLLCRLLGQKNRKIIWSKRVTC